MGLTCSTLTIILIASVIYFHFYTFVLIFNLLLIYFIFHLPLYPYLLNRSHNSISIIIFYFHIVFPTLVVCFISCNIAKRLLMNDIMSLIDNFDKMQSVFYYSYLVISLLHKSCFLCTQYIHIIRNKNGI